MPRHRLLVRYDGTDFTGSQVNPGARTVDGTLKAGLEGLIGEPVHLLWAGRTDAGVHAEGNVACFAGELSFPTGKLPELLNKRLPADVEVRRAEVVAEEFHPRFDALSREYVYRLYLAADVPVDRARYSAGYGETLNTELIGEALALLQGRHCFVNFCKRSEREQGEKRVRSAEECYCTMQSAELVEQGPTVELTFRADRFLRNMIRRLVSALLAVSQGDMNLDQLQALLSNTPKDFQLKPAPAKGLTLMKVSYPEVG